jgi:hypothetical protein
VKSAGKIKQRTGTTTTPGVFPPIATITVIAYYSSQIITPPCHSTKNFPRNMSLRSSTRINKLAASIGTVALLIRLKDAANVVLLWSVLSLLFYEIKLHF